MSHTAKQMLPAIGQTVCVALESMHVLCIVVDVKSAWGKVRLLVKPVTGTGEQWIEMARVWKPAGYSFSQEVAR
jgi:hypothetical protein